MTEKERFFWPKISSQLGWCTTLVGWFYFGAVIASWILLQWGDKSWLPTLWLFAPRGVVLLPLILLIPLTLLVRPKILIIYGLAALIAVGPVMGLCLPWRSWIRSTPEGTTISVLTCNMHSSHGETLSLESFVASCDPDVIAVQEWPVFARSSLAKMHGWHTHLDSRLFLASRFPITKTTSLGKHSMSDHGSAQLFELDSPAGKISLISLHLASIRHGINEVIHERGGGTDEIEANDALRLRQSEFIAEKAAQIQTPLIILGDFNTPPQSVIFQKVWHPYQDAFSNAGFGWGYTFFGSRTMVRIDHILTSKEWFCRDAQVGPFVGSPHRPVVTELILPGVH